MSLSALRTGKGKKGVFSSLCKLALLIRNAATTSSVAMADPNGFASGGSEKADGYVHSRESFLEVYPVLRDLVLNDEIYKGTAPFATEWLQEMQDYTVPGGKLNRGMAVFDVLRAVKSEEEITKDDVLKSNVAGWCIEYLQAFFLVADDIMDNSITRRGQPCWFRKENVGMIAFNDSIILEASIYRILKKFFQKDPCYGLIMELFHETTAQTAHGQMLDLITSPPDKVDLTRYTVENYFNIITFKTAYYSFYLPIACGLLIAGISDPACFDMAKQILIPMGQYFQVQDDYLDCHADPEVLGKIGTDIQDNKCSWLICQALKIGTEDQKKKIMASYGQDNQEAIETVKSVYRELKLDELFHKYEAESYEKLLKEIENQTLLPKAVFTSLLKKIYKRKK
ncbi:hypothetical protein BSKO_05382 [Bryopsis sp. KO-2023]|nr:hypothetical protein BSKO_05382 [Bryopsis sp. KO-2023]